MNATTSRPGRQLAPASGRVLVLRPLGAVTETTGEISINGKPYYLTCHPHGFRLTSYDSLHQGVTVYDLPLDLSSCDCPDATYRSERPGGCKHRKALQALKARGKI